MAAPPPQTPSLRDLHRVLSEVVGRSVPFTVRRTPTTTTVAVTGLLADKLALDAAIQNLSAAFGASVTDAQGASGGRIAEVEVGKTSSNKPMGGLERVRVEATEGGAVVVEFSGGREFGLGDVGAVRDVIRALMVLLIVHRS